MKKCPACDKTYEDSMRFCQVDGSELVADTPAFDPYATIVSHAVPVAEPVEETPVSAAEAEPDIHYTVGSIPISEPDDVLDLPSNDPLKTVYVSDAEMKEALGSTESESNPIDILPADEPAEPQPPSFIAPEPVPAYEPAAPPPSPFSTPEPPTQYEPEPDPTPYAVPTPVFAEPAEPAYDEMATMIQPSFNPSLEPPAPVEEWAPPPAPDPSWENKEINMNTPFQPPVAGVEGQNKTLAIVSLVSGILGLTICCGGLLPSLVALVTGFMAKGKASQNPGEYGGSGLAMGGIITGAIGLVGGIIFLVVYFVVGLASLGINN